MREWLQKLRKKKLNKKKEGSSLVSVIIGVAFLATIGLMVLTVATRYVVTVIVDRNSSDNFYEAEGVLAEVRTGLLEYAGNASDTSYQEVLENYTSMTSSMEETFTKKYLSGIASALQGTTYVWDDDNEKLGVLQPCDIANIKKLTKEPDAVTTPTGTDLAFVINHDEAKGYTLTLKNFVIDYTNAADYRSTIQTDIVFKAPDYKFEGNSTLDELKNYIVVSDDTLKVSGATNAEGAQGVIFNGNIYTGQKEEGIVVDQQNKATFRSQTIISRGSMDVYSGSNVSLSGEESGGNIGTGDLWLENIRLKSNGIAGSALSTTFDMKENAYISNDFDVQDNNANIKLSGKYYGYSYNENNVKSSSEKANAKYSSAILINGVNTTFDAGDINKMILAGRSFVSQNAADFSAVKSDIMMGESLAVKSNQIAYLVPDIYISVGHNPIATLEYNEVGEAIVSKDSLLASNLGAYLNSSEPFTANFSSTGFAYLFLNFKDEASANQYFYDYYLGNISEMDEDGNIINNSEQVAEKATTYLATTDVTNNKFSSNMFLIAGNIVHNYEATDAASGIQANSYYDASGEPNEELLADGKKMALGYLGRCLTLLPSGSEGRDEDGKRRLLADDKLLVADTIINFSKVTATMDKTDPESGGRIVVTSGDYVVDDSKITKGLLIAGGNVTVNADFEGLIIAGGKVTVNGHKTLTADMILTGDILEFAKKDEELSKIFHSLNGAEKQEATELEKCMSYQNWVKNTY